MSKMMQSEQIAAFCSLVALMQRHYGLWRLQEVSCIKMGILFVLIEVVAFILMLGPSLFDFLLLFGWI
jgi:hypothetical protein